MTCPLERILRMRRSRTALHTGFATARKCIEGVVLALIERKKYNVAVLIAALAARQGRETPA